MTWSLVADIGGTNARFASVVNGVLGIPQIIDSKGSVSLAAGLAQFVQDQGCAPESVLIAAAGTIKNGNFDLTNADQSLSLDEVRGACQTDDIQVINDFAAAAWALANVEANDVTSLRGPELPPQGHRIILGAGTGLGVGTLCHTGTRYCAIPGEGGHVALAPSNAQDIPVFEKMVEIWPEAQIGSPDLRLEAEAFLSGTGLPFLYEAYGGEKGATGAQIMARAQSGESAAVQTCKTFARYLGQVAGDLAISVLPRGGVFLTGGIIHKNPWLIGAEFMDAFDAGGRFTKIRQEMPIYIYEQELFGLIGAKNALSKK